MNIQVAEDQNVDGIVIRAGSYKMTLMSIDGTASIILTGNNFSGYHVGDSPENRLMLGIPASR